MVLANYYEEFLATVPLGEYRQTLMPIKTVEQDLPKDLNPLPDIYAHYWVEDIPAKGFPSYEVFFDKWWCEHLQALDRFVAQYFWGCSRDFVRTGFKARLYRTLISVLTQFHFAYLWREVCTLPLTASAELDMAGIDAIVAMPDGKIVLSVKKVTYRREAAGEGRFSGSKQMEQWKQVVEVAYTADSPENWADKERRARQTHTRERFHLYYKLAAQLQRQLPNGFVVFRPEYPLGVERLLATLPSEEKYISWERTLYSCLEHK